MSKPYQFSLLLSLLLMSSGMAVAQSKETTIKDFTWFDKQHMKSQREIVEDLARRNFGSGFSGDKRDLKLIQRIIDKSLIKRDDIIKLQALGAILGDVLVEQEKLEWKAYEDPKGRSRAVCVKDTQHCLFPITMLSRRIKVGLMPRVNDVYARAADIISGYKAKNPYDAVNHKKYKPGT